LEAAVDREIDSYPRVLGGEPMLSRESNAVFQKAADYATRIGDQYVSLEHLLLALVSVSSSASQILKAQGVSENQLELAIKELRKGEKVTSQTAEETYQALSKYAVNLTEMARQGKLDPVIGRDEEIRRILQILSRRTKNNCVRKAGKVFLLFDHHFFFFLSYILRKRRCKTAKPKNGIYVPALAGR
jgi:ATP-dependent Clp protease ATP-binding subunit ClpB